ncbi:MAG: hypothetical protein ACR2N7_10005 [Acidimicrobiia bacterium]
MRKRLILVGLVVVGILVIPVAAQATAPETMQLSSWRPDTAEGVVIGGEQTVTVTNTSSVARSNIEFGLAGPPCDCSLSSSSSSHGDVEASTWHIGTLSPGETAYLDLTYAQSAVTPLSAEGMGAPVPMSWLTTWATNWPIGLLIAVGALPLVLQRRAIRAAH